MTMTLEDLDAVQLPPAIQADLEGGHPTKAPLDPQGVLADLAKLLIPERQEAIDGRLMSGIEYAWDQAEEGYAAIDNVNRAESVNRIKWTKPLAPEGGLTSTDRKRDDGDLRSTVLPPIIARYVDAGTAKVCEILLPPDEKSFSFTSTPHPDTIKGKEDTRQLQTPDGTLLERDARPEELAPPPVPASLPPSPPPSAQLAPGAEGAPAPLLVRDLAKETLEKAEAAALEAQELVQDWMVEGRYRAEMRKVVFDAGKLGVGVLKGPYPVPQRSVVVHKDSGDKVTMTVVDKIVPGYKRINPWHFYPDPSCGENIQDGEYCWERDFITERRLRGLSKEDGYLEDMIARVIQEGPGKRLLDERTAAMNPKDHRYEIWYRTGYLTREQVEALNPDVLKTVKQDLTQIPMLCTIVNDTVIRGVLHVLDTGSFNYHAIPWRRRADQWAGSGVSEQLEAPVRIIVSALRALVDNAGQSAGSQIVVDALCISPVDNNWRITPNKLWKMSGDSLAGDVEKAFQVFTFPNVGAALIEIITLGFRLCEESTNIPLISQGQSGPTTPETLGATQIQDSNANQMLRAIAENHDDYCTIPVAKQNYELLLMDPDVPDSAKGDYQIHAHGAMLVERHIQQQIIAGLAPISANPLYGLDPKRWVEQYLRGNKLQPINFKFSKEEQEKLDQAPPPKAPQVQAAEIRAQVDVQKSKLDVDRDTEHLKAESERTQIERDTRLAELDATTKLEMLKYANARAMSLEQVKADLAGLVMKLTTQKQLAAQDRAAEVVTPPTEPSGRAEPGKSFSQ
jgi:hypothetical protein